MLKEFKKKIIPKFYVLLKRVLKVNVMTVGAHKAGPYKLVSEQVDPVGGIAHMGALARDLS